MFEIINETGTKICDIDEVKKVLNKVVQKEHLEDALFNVILVDNTYIHRLNKEYRGIDRPTDVISFALEDEKEINSPIRILGDIYISVDKIEEQRILYGHSYLREFAFLSVHGLLHLLGYDHMTKEEEKKMFAYQEEILNEAGITK